MRNESGDERGGEGGFLSLKRGLVSFIVEEKFAFRGKGGIGGKVDMMHNGSLIEVDGGEGRG